MVKGTAVESAKEHSALALETAARRLRIVQRVAFDVLPISERDYIERALDFASWDGADAGRLAQLNLELQIGCALIDSDGERQPLASTPALAASLTETSVSYAAFRRNNMRKSLGAIVDAHARRRKPSKLIETGRDTRGHAIAIWRGREMFGEPLWMFFPFDLGAAIKTALDLLTDWSRPYCRSLRQCPLPGCGGYFLLPSKLGRGQPPKYHDACRLRERAKNRHKK